MVQKAIREKPEQDLLRALRPEDHRRILTEIRPMIGKYGWMLRLLRRRFKKRGGFPHRALRVVRRLAKTNKPYFVGVTANGTRFLGNIFDDYSVSWAIDDSYDAAIVEFLVDQAKSVRRTYVDGGANCGILAASVARFLHKDAEVVAFEPVPDTARRAAVTFALNGLNNARLYVTALGDTKGEFKLYRGPGNCGWTSAYPPNVSVQSKRWTEERVVCHTLDDIVACGEVKGVEFIKLDVEGHEFSVLRGAKNTLAHTKPAIFYEYNPLLMGRAGWTGSDVSALLQDQLGYRMVVFKADMPFDAFPPRDDIPVSNIFCRSSAFADS